jgi:hypothetical protein
VVLRLYNEAGYTISQIHADNEFRPLFEAVADELDVTMNYTNAGDHVPEAERNNRVIQERIRTAYHRLPYKAIPKTMLKHLAMISAQQLNYFPAKGGISAHYSPYSLIKRRALDFIKHLKYGFGICSSFQRQQPQQYQRTAHPGLHIPSPQH